MGIIERDYATSPQAYAKELAASKYCLVLRCDDPQTSRFYDSIAAGCIPIVISDGFHLVVVRWKPTPSIAREPIVTQKCQHSVSALTLAHFAAQAPFSSVVNYASFSVTIPESMWMKDVGSAARFACALCPTPNPV